MESFLLTESNKEIILRKEYAYNKKKDSVWKLRLGNIWEKYYGVVSSPKIIKLCWEYHYHS